MSSAMTSCTASTRNHTCTHHPKSKNKQRTNQLYEGKKKKDTNPNKYTQQQQLDTLHIMNINPQQQDMRTRQNEKRKEWFWCFLRAFHF